MSEHTWERVSDPDDPRRCQAMTSRGQCYNKSLPGINYCPAHGASQAKKLKKQQLANYKLNKFKQRAGELGNSDAISSLKDEIGLLRMLVEERINRCEDSHDLLLVSGPLSDLFIKIEKLVSSGDRLDRRLGNLLDKTKVLLFAQTVVEIIGSEIDDPEKLDSISDKILKAFSSLD